MLEQVVHIISFTLQMYKGKYVQWTWRSWLRHCATSQKVAGSIPDGIFHWHNPFGRSMALGSTQPLTILSTMNSSWGGKGRRCVGFKTLPLSCANCHEIWETQPPGTLGACSGLYRDCFTFLRILNGLTCSKLRMWRLELWTFSSRE